MFAVERTCTDPGLHLANCTEATRFTQLAPEHKVLASAFADGKPLGRLNDVQADGHGGAFFTQTGLYHVAADGAVSVVADKVDSFTNGLAEPRRQDALRHRPDQDPRVRRGGGRRHVDPPGVRYAGHETKGFGADGLAADSAGRLYAAGDAGVDVIDPWARNSGSSRPAPRDHPRLRRAGQAHALHRCDGRGRLDGKDWQTPKDVSNVAMTVYQVKMLAAAPANKPKYNLLPLTGEG